MGDVFFKPWIGEKYEGGGLWPKRVLILGESCYASHGRTPTELYSVQCIKEQISGDHRYRFWTNIAAAFLNKRPSLKDKAAFWHSVAFYNYVQQVVGAGPRVRPSKEAWASSRDAFLKMLRQLRPQCVIVLGYALWQHLSDMERIPGPELQGAHRPQTWLYHVVDSADGPRALTYCIRHPSSGFSSRNEHPFIKRAIELA